MDWSWKQMFIPNERGTDLETKLLELRAHVKRRTSLPWLTKLCFEIQRFWTCVASIRPNSTCQSDQERLEPTNCFLRIHIVMQCHIRFLLSFFLFPFFCFANGGTSVNLIISRTSLHMQQRLETLCSHKTCTLIHYQMSSCFASFTFFSFSQGNFTQFLSQIGW